MVVVMKGVLEIMARFLQTIGPYDNAFVTPSRRRFMAHFAARDADAAVAEMESLLKRLEKNYLSRVRVLPQDHRSSAAQPVNELS
jgi:GntR family transcriptional regulator, transcriptional repressor for pyruvate dehydrogenase complex